MTEQYAPAEPGFATRLLPPQEWSRLAGTELETVMPHCDPALHRVLVVEKNGAIVACWLLFQQWHVEGIWIAPEHRKRGRVGWRLLEAMRALARGLGARSLMTGSCSEDVSRLLAHVGAEPLPGVHYVMRIN